MQAHALVCNIVFVAQGKYGNEQFFLFFYHDKLMLMFVASTVQISLEYICHVFAQLLSSFTIAFSLLSKRNLVPAWNIGFIIAWNLTRLIHHTKKYLWIRKKHTHLQHLFFNPSNPTSFMYFISPFINIDNDMLFNYDMHTARKKLVYCVPVRYRRPADSIDTSTWGHSNTCLWNTQTGNYLLQFFFHLCYFACGT